MDSTVITGLVVGFVWLDMVLSWFMYHMFAEDTWNEKYYFCPHIIYNHTKCNWVGSALISILFIALSNLYILYLILYWIFHVGRNNKKHNIN